MGAGTESASQRIAGGVYRTALPKNIIPEPEKPTGPTGGSALAPAHVDGRLCCRLAVDIGGTFTDVVLEDGEDGSKRIAVKVLTTPQNPEKAFLEGAMRALRESSRKPEQVRLVLHGTTLATNAVLERRGAVTAVVTTRGFRDVLDIGRGGRHDVYDLNLQRTRPIVPRSLRFEVPERLKADGSVLEPLDETYVEELVEQLQVAKVESIAVCFMHSYANNRHEERAATIIRTLLPGVKVCTSSSVCPEIREYERFSTAVVNAYVQPLMSRYLNDVQRELNAAGFKCPLLLMTSSGGLCDADTAAALPVRLVESGPAGGVSLAENVARELGEEQVLSFDMGGTTAKLCAVSKARAMLSRQFEVDRAERFRRNSGLPVRVPCVDLVEICGGGGSIASTNSVGVVAVGPRSAGSEPGPACYGRGGHLATVTDADVILGRIDPVGFAAGEVRLDSCLARTALQQSVTTPQGFSSDEFAAHAVAEAVEEAIAVAARAHVSEHSCDIDRCTLVAFGGAAPLRAAGLAEKLGLRRVLIPPDASVGSAVGFLSAPLSFEAVRSRPMLLTATSFDAEKVNEIFRGLWHETISVVAAGAARWKPGRPAKERRRAYGRYRGQGHEIPVDLPNRDFDPTDAATIREAFESAYSKLFYRPVDEHAEVEILAWALEVVADSDPVAWHRDYVREQLGKHGLIDCADTFHESQPAALEPDCERMMFDVAHGRCVGVPSYRRDCLVPGARLVGPAVVTERYTTTVITAQFICTVLEGGFLQLDRRSDPRESFPVQVIGTAASLQMQLIWKRLLASVEEQSQVLLRAVFSPISRESVAISCGMFDQRGRLLCQSETGSPGLAAVLVKSVAQILTVFDCNDLVEGDAIFSNNALAASDPCDLIVLTPVFGKTRCIIGFVASIAQTAPFRNEACAGERHCRHSAVPLVSKGSVVQDVVLPLRKNSVRPADCVGDVYALLACNELGIRRIREALSDFGAQDLTGFAEHVFRMSREAALREVTSLIPDGGSWTHELEVDGQCDAAGDVGSALSITATVKINNGEVHVDVRPTTFACSLACPLVYTEAYITFALACVFGGSVPRNAGSASIYHVNVPEGSALGAVGPCETVGRRLVAHLLPDLVFGCLSQPLPSKIPAEGAAATCRIDIECVGSSGGAPSMPVVATHVESGGCGARPDIDGLSSTAFPSSLQSTPVEVTESDIPMLVQRRELRRDSGGVGLHRGGLGVRLHLAPADSAKRVRVSFAVGHVHRRPRGRAGGFAGVSANVALASGRSCPSSKGEVTLGAGDALVLDTAGGGGFGPPSKRPRLAVSEDVRDGFISREAALRDYSLAEADLAAVR